MRAGSLRPGPGRAFLEMDWAGRAGLARGPEPGRAGIRSRIKKLTKTKKYLLFDLILKVFFKSTFF